MGAPTVIHNIFADNITNQQVTAYRAHLGNIDEVQRIWRLPPRWPGDPLDIPNFKPPFDRSLISVDYMLSFSSLQGREADAVAAKLQGDHVSAQERAFRFRHASHIRCGMHSANRRKGHALAGGGVFARVVGHVQDVIVSRNAGD